MRCISTIITHESSARYAFALVLIAGLITVVGCESSNQSSTGDENSSLGSREVRRSKGSPKSAVARKPITIEDGNWSKEVLQANELVVVDFWAPWCGPCRTMTPIMDSLANDYKVCKVDVDSNIDLATEHKVSTIPRIMVFRDGEKVYEHVGTVSEDTLREELEKLTRR